MSEQEARLEYMLDTLLAELPAQKRPEKPTSAEQRRQLARALVNVRPPGAVSAAFLEAQDAFLQEELRQKGIVYPDEIAPRPAVPRLYRLSLWQGDITRLAVDGIVNAANAQLLGCFAPNHHCIDNAIHTAAGVQLRQACQAIMARQGHAEPVGQAKVTEGYNLPARYVIHTVGPQVEGRPTAGQEQELASCYRACLDAAAAQGMRTLAFCCISTGVFGFPQARAAEIAVAAVCERLKDLSQIERVIFNVFTDQDRDIYEKVLAG
ncbi:MAG: protein-ADP-ribose hydrolase [bacterium]|nr:protein-ADP-ribose hydrolase [bacterium]